MAASIVQQNASHDLGSHAKEVTPVLPFNRTLINQTEVSFVDERGRLQGMVAALLSKIVTGQAPEFVVE